MFSALLHNLAVCGLVAAMLVAPVAGVHPLGCDECSTLADWAVSSGNSHDTCCASASPAQSLPTSSSDCSEYEHSSVPCQLCCDASPATAPILPASNAERIDFGVKSLADVQFVVDANVASSFPVRTTSGSFWTLAADGPSRQAMLCRFTT
jgi:hypothetical protein